MDIDGLSPAMTLKITIDTFIDSIKTRNNNFILRENDIRKVMCNATCVMYHAMITQTEFTGPHREFPRPLVGWNDELEYAWQFYIHSTCYDWIFWENFWGCIPKALWEESMPDWRYTIADILVQYLQPNIANMIKAKVLLEHSDGTLSVYQEKDDEEY